MSNISIHAALFARLLFLKQRTQYVPVIDVSAGPSLVASQRAHGMTGLLRGNCFHWTAAIIVKISAWAAKKAWASTGSELFSVCLFV